MSDLTPTGESQPEAEKKQNQPGKVVPIFIGLVWITFSGSFLFYKSQQQLYGLPIEGKVVEIGKPSFRTLPKGQKKLITRVWVKYAIAAVNYKQRFELQSAAHLTVGSPVPLSYFANSPNEAWMRESILPVIASAISLFFGLAFVCMLLRG